MAKLPSAKTWPLAPSLADPPHFPGLILSGPFPARTDALRIVGNGTMAIWQIPHTHMQPPILPRHGPRIDGTAALSALQGGFALLLAHYAYNITTDGVQVVSRDEQSYFRLTA